MDAPKTITLRDGRVLAYAERGDAAGPAVVHSHANPAGRLESWGAAQLEASGVRIITPDRPGIGASDPKGDRTVADWADDVRQLADTLELERFAVTGLSLGGTYALASAAALPERVTAVGLISAPGRLDRPGAVDELGIARVVNLARRAPWAPTAGIAVLARIARRRPKLAHRLFWSDSPPVDRAVVDRPGVAERFLRTLVAATSSGARGIVDDMRVPLRPWGFDPADVRAPIVLWHGSADHVVPLGQAEQWLGVLPDARLTRCDGEGHFLIEDRLGEILDVVVS